LGTLVLHLLKGHLAEKGAILHVRLNLRIHPSALESWIRGVLGVTDRLDELLLQLGQLILD
jgi:hypothetical protein